MRTTCALRGDSAELGRVATIARLGVGATNAIVDAILVSARSMASVRVEECVGNESISGNSISCRRNGGVVLD